MEKNTIDFFNKLAVNWDSHSRLSARRIEELVDLCEVKANEKILDIGCGTGILDGELSKCGQLTAIDFSQEMIAVARKKYPSVDFRICDFYTFDERGFDIAIIFNAYPHFTDTAAFAKKLSRVLKTGGRFILMHDADSAAVNAHHAGLDGRLSRDLKSAREECAVFQAYFSITRVEEYTGMYFIGGQKI